MTLGRTIYGKDCCCAGCRYKVEFKATWAGWSDYQLYAQQRGAVTPGPVWSGNPGDPAAATGLSWSAGSAPCPDLGATGLYKDAEAIQGALPDAAGPSQDLSFWYNVFCGPDPDYAFCGGPGPASANVFCGETLPSRPPLLSLTLKITNTGTEDLYVYRRSGDAGTILDKTTIPPSGHADFSDVVFFVSDPGDVVVADPFANEWLTVYCCPHPCCQPTPLCLTLSAPGCVLDGAKVRLDLEQPTCAGTNAYVGTYHFVAPGCCDELGGGREFISSGDVVFTVAGCGEGGLSNYFLSQMSFVNLFNCDTPEDALDITIVPGTSLWEGISGGPNGGDCASLSASLTPSTLNIGDFLGIDSFYECAFPTGTVLSGSLSSDMSGCEFMMGGPQRLPVVVAARPPCDHLGTQTGEQVQCVPCGGNVRIKLHVCAVHGKCSTHRELPEVACCLTCPDYQPPAPEKPNGRT